MDSLHGKRLIDNRGCSVPAKSALRNKKYIVYYFSAAWCKPCVILSSKLREIYAESVKRDIPLQIIFVSLDNSEADMLEHFRKHHGRWLAVPFGDNAAEELRLRFGVTSIPYIIVTKTDGTIVTINGKKDVEELGINVLVTWIC